MPFVTVPPPASVTVQVTAVLVLLVTVAVNTTALHASIVADAGLIEMATTGAGAVTVTVAVEVPEGVATLRAVTTYVPAVAGAT